MKPITGQELCHGSHHIFGKTGVRKIITVPVHGNEELKHGLAARIARDANLSW